jgi:hypothetical protein
LNARSIDAPRLKATTQLFSASRFRSVMKKASEQEKRNSFAKLDSGPIQVQFGNRMQIVRTVLPSSTMTNILKSFATRSYRAIWRDFSSLMPNAARILTLDSRIS